MNGNMSRPKRAPMTVNPVTGELRRAPSTKGKHTSGCVQIEERYLHAARDAGLGGSQGMYGHMSIFKRTGADVLRPTEGAAGSGPGDLGGGVGGEGAASKSFLFSTGHGSRAGGVEKRKPLRQRMSEANRARRGKPSGSGGGGTVKKPGSNIRHVVQGRSRRVGGGSSGNNGAGDSAFARSKGVVSTLSGASNVKLHNKKAAVGAGRVHKQGRVTGRGAAGTRVHTTAKGGQVHMLSHANERSCRAGGTQGGAKHGGVMAGGVRVMAPASRRAGGGSSRSVKPKSTQTTASKRRVGGGRSSKPVSKPSSTARKPSNKGRGMGGGRQQPRNAAELREARARYFEQKLGGGA